MGRRPDYDDEDRVVDYSFHASKRDKHRMRFDKKVRKMRKNKDYND